MEIKMEKKEKRRAEKMNGVDERKGNKGKERRL